MARPPLPESERLILVQGRVPKPDADYLGLWASEQGLALRELLPRARKFWPTGLTSPDMSDLPALNAPKKERRTSAIALYAKRNGLTLAQVENMAWQAFLKTLQEEAE